ncbi:TPA: hypothetical protein ACM4HS_004960, partial [Escherichia coli]
QKAASSLTLQQCPREGIEPGVGEELQHEIPALEDHPAGVPENDSEAQPFIEGGGGIEIS